LDDFRLRRVAVTNADRDPFRFQQRVTFAVARPSPRRAGDAAVVPSPLPVQETWVQQAPAPPIRFIGSLAFRGARWAIFSDCAGYTAAARPGEWFLGEWEVLRIGEESAVVERTGAAPARIPMTGCTPG
jgi:hypothetical protein